jgi:hypothetical protein
VHTILIHYTHTLYSGPHVGQACEYLDSRQADSRSFAEHRGQGYRGHHECHHPPPTSARSITAPSVPRRDRYTVLTVHCTHCTLYSLYTVLTVHCTHCTLYSLYTLLALHCTHCTLYSLYTVLTVHCTHCTLCSLYTVLTVHCTHCTLFSLYTLLTVHSTHCTLYSLYRPRGGGRDLDRWQDAADSSGVLHGLRQVW